MLRMRQERDSSSGVESARERAEEDTVSGQDRWVDPDWGWLEPIDFEEAPMASSTPFAVVLLGGMALGLLAALWYLL